MQQAQTTLQVVDLSKEVLKELKRFGDIQLEKSRCATFAYFKGGFTTFYPLRAFGRQFPEGYDMKQAIKDYAKALKKLDKKSGILAELSLATKLDMIGYPEGKGPLNSFGHPNGFLLVSYLATRDHYYNFTEEAPAADNPMLGADYIRI